MELTWKRMYLGCWHGYLDGQFVAEIGDVPGPDGASVGWSVHLVQQEHEPFEYFPAKEAAEAAAEAALATG